MSLDKLLNHVEHIFLTGDVSDQILAIQILSRFPNTKHLLLKGLDSNIIDVVITSLECLAIDKHAPIESIIHSLQNWDDSEVKLAALNAIEHNQGSEQADEFLVELICDDSDYWEGDWNDGDDIRLNAARILDNHEHDLKRDQALRLLSLFQNDLEPDLRSRLISVLSRHSTTLLEEGDYLTRITDIRVALKSTSNKISLYKGTQHQDLRCQQIAFQRLSEMNCREYLQLFLTGLSHSDSKIRRTSLDTLANWNYQIALKYLGDNGLWSEIPIKTVSVLLSSSDKQHLINRWQVQQHPTQTLTAILWLISSLEVSHIQQQLDRFMPIFYKKFSNLDEVVQLDCLNILFDETTHILSVAFIRQQLQSNTISNSVRQQLIEHLAHTSLTEHQAYLKELVIGLPEIFTTDTTEKQESLALAQSQGKNDFGEDDAQPLVTSTLEALTRTTHSKPQAKSVSKKRVHIEELTNQPLAIKHCRNGQWLVELCSEQTVANLTKTTLHALIIALHRNNISFTHIETQHLSHLVFELIVDVDCSNLDSIVDWLGTSWIKQHRLQLMELESLPLQTCLVPYTTDEPELLALLKHPYISIQIAALKQLKQSTSHAHEELINLILDEPILYPQINHFEANTVYNVLLQKVQHSPSVGLQAMLSFIGTSDSHTI
ncbi:hypothetical protein A143_22305 [Vibrio splendidus ZS-139]|nr:hypothetical protein A143_22305 [Vibrio splendidus ZS-139]